MFFTAVLFTEENWLHVQWLMVKLWYLQPVGIMLRWTDCHSGGLLSSGMVCSGFRQYSKRTILQSLSCIQLFMTPWTATCQSSLSFTTSQSLLKLLSIESVMPSNHLIFCHPILLLPSFLPSIRVFSSELVLHIRWPKYWSFIFSISPSNEYSGLISCRIDWFDLAVQGTLKSLFQYHSSKASILWHSAFFIVQLLHPYIFRQDILISSVIKKCKLKPGSHERYKIIIYVIEMESHIGI